MRALRWWSFIAVSLGLAALLTLVPLPDVLRWYRPQWFMLWVIFCQLQFPRQFNPWYAWSAGLLLDMLFGSLLGFHALVLTLIAYLTALLRSRFVARPFWQQMGKIFIMVSFGQIIVLWGNIFLGHHPHTIWYWMSILTSCALWPVWVGMLNTFSLWIGTSPYASRTVLS